MIVMVAILLAQSLAGHSIVYSARDKTVVLVSGDAAGNLPLYRLARDKWIPIPNSDLPARSLAAVASDTDGNILVHGGAVGIKNPNGGIDFKVSSETWFWNGKKWTFLGTGGPSARDHHAMAYDSNRHRFVMFGGSDADPSGRSEFFGDTWEWYDGAWHRASTTGPSARCHFAMAFDAPHDEVLLVGGYGPHGGDDKTWAWDGTQWYSVSQGAPADRSSPRMVWSDTQKMILLFGGESGDTRASDTWAWSGSKWTQIAQTGPPGRTVHGLAWDSTLKRMILYGGANGNDVLDDIWTFGVGSWKRVS